MDDQGNKGKGWHGDTEGHRKAGEKAAQTAEERYGEDFHEEIGRLGGESQGKENNPGNFANDPEKASRAGREGGRSRGDNE